jgi:hypothetical protein
MELVVEPYDYAMHIGGELRSSAYCKGVSFRVSNKGEVQVYNKEGRLVASTPEQEKEYEMIRLSWQQGLFHLSFGYSYLEDTYPNCDGEYDRWVPAWATQHSVKYYEDTDRLEIVKD